MATVAFLAVASAPAAATDPASRFDAPGQSHANLCAHLAGPSAALRFADASETGFTVSNGLTFDPGQCPDGTVRLDLHELIPSAGGPLAFHRGGNGYVDDKNVKYGELATAEIADALPPTVPASGGRGAACTLSGEPVYQVHVRSISGRMRYKRPPNTGSSFSHYGDPGSDQGDRRDVHYTYLLWSFLDVLGGGHVRVLLKPDQYVRPCDVQPLTMSSWDANGNVNGQVTARYVQTLAGSCPVYGWMVWSHTYLERAPVAHALPASSPPPPDPAPDPSCPVAAPAQPPQVTTGAATQAPGGGWALAGAVNPVGTTVSYHFDYGLDPAVYGQSTPSGPAGPADRFLPVTAVANGLQPLTTYHYRLVATSVHGTTFGPDATLVTPAAAAPKQPRPVTLGRLRVSPRAFRRARRRSGSPARISYVLSAPARVMLTFERRVVGVRRSYGCRPAPRGRLARGTPRCFRWVAVRGSLHQSARAGAIAVRFGGWIGGRALASSRYRVRAVATGRDGRRGVARQAGFTVR